jgi:hypothetical protein
MAPNPTPATNSLGETEWPAKAGFLFLKRACGEASAVPAWAAIYDRLFADGSPQTRKRAASSSAARAQTDKP